MTANGHVAAANLALVLADHHACHAKHGATSRLDDVRACAHTAINQLRAALAGAHPSITNRKEERHDSYGDQKRRSAAGTAHRVS